MKEMEIIARGVWSLGGEVLLCRNRRKGNVYLPGGHIEPGESAITALAREWEEEIGRPCRVVRFLGAAEHTFIYKGRRTFEVNLVFECRQPGWRAGRAVASREEKLEFFWHPLNRLKDIALEPRPLQNKLAAWLRAGSDSVGWASSYRT